MDAHFFQRSWRQALVLSTCLSLCPGGLQAQQPARPPLDATLPALGDVSSQTLSPAAERKLGDRVMRSLLRDPSIADDPLILEYVQSVWTSLLAAARQRGDIGPDIDDTYAWRPFLVRDRSVNAFALPGGYIGIHMGLLAVTRSADELASVLAHEMSHVTQRHIARMMTQSKQQSWVGLAAMVLGALAASRSPQAAQAMILGGQGVAVQGQLNFSRDMEREADRVGFGMLGEAGFSAAGMAQMFEQLQQAARLNDDNSFPYLRTHPLTTERIGEARARMGTNAWTRLPQPEVVAVQTRHALMSARSRVLMDTRSASLQGLVRPALLPAHASPLERLSQHYMVVVAATQLRDRALAEDALAQARKVAAALPDAARAEAGRVLTLAEAELAIDIGRAPLALKLLQPGSPVPSGPSPGATSPAARSQRPEVVLEARAALNLPQAADAGGALRDAANALQPLVGLHPDDAVAWTLLSSTWARLGQPLRAVRADAEASAASGDLQGAIDRVESARRRFSSPGAADLIELSVMDARVVRWRQIIKEDSRDDLN